MDVDGVVEGAIRLNYTWNQCVVVLCYVINVKTDEKRCWKMTLVAYQCHLSVNQSAASSAAAETADNIRKLCERTLTNETGK